MPTVGAACPTNYPAALMNRDTGAVVTCVSSFWTEVSASGAISTAKHAQLALGASGFTIRFDDSIEDSYTVAAPLLDTYGFRGSFGINTANLGAVGQMTAAEVIDLYERGHEICSHSNNHEQWSGNLPGTPATIDVLEAAIVADVAWFQANLGFDVPPCFFVPYSQWTQMDTLGCENSLDSERLTAPCRQPLAAMAYPNAQTTGTSAAGLRRTQDRYDMRGTDFPQVAYSGTLYAQQVIETFGMGTEGQRWATFGFHELGGVGEIGATEFEALLVELKTFVDAGRLVNLTFEEAMSFMYQGKRSNHVVNPSLNYREPADNSNLKVVGWDPAVNATDKDDCTTNSGSNWLCYEADPGWPERNIGYTDKSAVSFQVEDLEVGRDYVMALLVDFPVGTQGTGVGLLINNYGGGDRFDDDVDSRGWWDGYIEPGNGAEVGPYDVAEWNDGEWGIVWQKFTARQKTTTTSIQFNLGTGCTASYGSETDCYARFKWPVVYPLGEQSGAAASDPSEMDRVPLANNRFYQKATGQVVSGSSSACVTIPDIWDAMNTIHQGRHPRWFMVNRVELNKTANTGAALRFEVYGDSACTGMRFFSGWPDPGGDSMPCTDDPCISWSGLSLVRNTEASFAARETYPDFGDADQSNRFWVKIYNDDASSTTLDWVIDGIVAD